MSLSGSQVTRLWPHGGSGDQYGSFAGKSPATGGKSYAATFTRMGVHGSIAIPYGDFAGKSTAEPEPPPAATVTPSGGYPAYERLLDERAKRRRKATDDEDRIGEAPVPLVAPVAADATAKPKRGPNALREARRALANPLAREPDSAARQEAMQAQALKAQQAADLAQAVAELAAARLYARQRDDEEALILLLQ